MKKVFFCLMAMMGVMSASSQRLRVGELGSGMTTRQLFDFASADLKDTEPYTSPRVKTWKGRALLVVRSTQKKGSVNVSIKSTLPTAKLTLQSR